jgi:hypothetical protein
MPLWISACFLLLSEFALEDPKRRRCFCFVFTTLLGPRRSRPPFDFCFGFGYDSILFPLINLDHPTKRGLECANAFPIKY